MRLFATERALDLFNTGLAFAIALQTPSEKVKGAAKQYALNNIARIKNALYECSDIDKYTPHKSLEYWEEVREIVSKF